MVYTGSTRDHPWKSRKGERVMDGKGVAKCVNGDVYEGEVRLGMFDGMGIMRYANGDVFEGQWQTGLRHGYGVLDTHDGTSYVGLFHMGEKDGLSEESCAAYHFSGVYRDGLPHGLGRMELSNGDTYNAVWCRGRLHGRCTIDYAHGDTFVGTFVHGVVEGEGVYTQCDTGDTYTEVFEYGKCILGVLDEGVEVVRGDGNFVPPLSKSEREKEALDALTACSEESQRPLTTMTSVSQLARLRKKDPSQEERRARICVVKYRATGDEYRGEWLRQADGTNRRGVRHDQGRLKYDATGDVYEGEFRDDLREGHGVLHIASTSTAGGKVRTVDTSSIHPVKYEGDFHLDYCDGRGKLTLSDGTIVEGFWTRGMRNGLSHAHPSVDAVRFHGEVRSQMFEMGDETDLDYHRRQPDESATSNPMDRVEGNEL